MVLTVALGAVFAALVRAQQRIRIVLAAVAFALTGWAVLQYFLFPLLFPLVSPPVAIASPGRERAGAKRTP
ncbi:MAG TPA: hypothetical protein VHE80_06660 [Acidimicrobiales bacterium]|nr:hypothetical protein [Acidimicrobiales bacterium]